MSKAENQVEYTAEGVNVVDEQTDLNNAAVKKVLKQVPPRGRTMYIPKPKVYVDDGSKSSNLLYTYSYKVYNDGEKPSITNHYANNYPSGSMTQNSQDPSRLHPTSDSGGYSDYTFPVRKQNVMQDPSPRPQ